MDRTVSTSAQRLRNVLRTGAHHTRVLSMQDAFTELGMRVKQVSVDIDQDKSMAALATTYVLNATGWHADGTPFAFRSQPFTGDPVARAKLAAEYLVSAHTTTERTADMDTAQTDATTDAAQADTAQTTTTPLPPAPTLTDAPAPAAAPAQPSAAAIAAVKTHAPAQPGDLKGAISRMRAHRADLTREVIEMESKLSTAMQGAKEFISNEKAVVQEFLDEVNQLTNGGPTS
jgi:hypothetical protein